MEELSKDGTNAAKVIRLAVDTICRSEINEELLKQMEAKNISAHDIYVLGHGAAVISLLALANELEKKTQENSV